MKKLLALLFLFSITTSSALAWGWGDCPHSNKENNQDNSKEQIENSQSSD